MEDPEQSPKWVKIYKHPDIFHVELLRQMLEESGIQVVLLNKKDVYGLTGHVELYTLAEDEEKANQLIQTANHE